jgi:hypothetical protein
MVFLDRRLAALKEAAISLSSKSKNKKNNKKYKPK